MIFQVESANCLKVKFVCTYLKKLAERNLSKQQKKRLFRRCGGQKQVQAQKITVKNNNKTDTKLRYNRALW